MRIANFDLEEKILIVAEIGNNHEGDPEVAMKLVQRAAECGADAVKFQTFQTKYFVSRSDEARYLRLKSFELSHQDFERLASLAKSLGLIFMSTPLDLESAGFLDQIVDCYKIASGDNNFYALIRRICETGKPVIMSSGLSDLGQIIKSQRFIEEQWKQLGIEQELAVLHCVTSYPVPPDQANLAAIPLLADRLGCTVGYSDHTSGTGACTVAVALGARIIEKHFTLDKQYSDFRDHQVSADPEEMKELVARIALVRQMLGQGNKALQSCEEAIAQVARRSIVAAADLPPGHKLAEHDLTWIRPAIGLPPGSEAQVVGRTTKRALAFGEPILLNDLE